MVESNENIIDLSFFDITEKKNLYTVLIILNRPIIKNLYLKLKEKVDFVICADGAANRMYDNLGIENSFSIPDCIVGDFDSIRPEVQEFYNIKGVKLLKRLDQDTTDLEKSLYVSLEKICEYDSGSSYEPNSPNKKFSIIILGASGGRIDHTFSAYSQVFKYLENYAFQFKETEILLLSKSSCSIYLKPGMNKIITSSTWEQKRDGYSVIPINGEANIEVVEDDKNIFYAKKFIKFGENLFFRKKHNANNIFINVTVDDSARTGIIYSFTTKFHNDDRAELKEKEKEYDI